MPLLVVRSYGIDVVESEVRGIRVWRCEIDSVMVEVLVQCEPSMVRNVDSVERRHGRTSTMTTEKTDYSVVESMNGFESQKGDSHTIC